MHLVIRVTLHNYKYFVSFLSSCRCKTFLLLSSHWLPSDKSALVNSPFEQTLWDGRSSRGHYVVRSRALWIPASCFSRKPSPFDLSWQNLFQPAGNKKIFNYRLSKARLIAEDTLGCGGRVDPRHYSTVHSNVFSRCMGTNQGARVEGMAGAGLVSLNKVKGEAELEEDAEVRTHESSSDSSIWRILALSSHKVMQFSSLWRNEIKADFWDGSCVVSMASLLTYNFCTGEKERKTG